MKPWNTGFRFSFCLSLLPLLAAQTSPQQETGALSPGIIVEKVVKNFEAEKTGIQEGDILLRWVRADLRGEIRSPFDLAAVEIEQAPRGAVTLEGLRGAEKKVWPLGQDVWGIRSRPNFSNTALTLYREGRDLATAGKPTAAAEEWRAIAGQPTISRTWLLFHLAELQAEGQHWKECDQAYQEALEVAAGEPEVIAQIQSAWGNTFIVRSDWEHGGEHLREAVAAEEGTGKKTLGLAVVLDDLGSLARKQGDLKKAEGYYQQAFHIREELAPDSLSLATSLTRLGALAKTRSDLGTAQSSAQRALALAEKIAPTGLTVADALNNLGDVVLERGNLAAANDYYNRCLDIRNRLEPGSLDVAKTLNQMGIVAWRGGEMAKAEQYYRQALAIREKAVPGSLDVAGSLNNLGILAWEQGNLPQSAEYFHQALAIKEKLAPGSLDLAATLNNLGYLSSDGGDLAKAEQYHHQAIAIIERLAPSSVDLATSFMNLGIIARERGDLAKAEQYHRQGLDIQEKVAPGSMDGAESLNLLGLVALQRGDLVKAEQYERQALAIKEKLAPGSPNVAETLNSLGLVTLQRGEDLGKAEEYFRQSLAIIEKATPGSTDVADLFHNLGLVANQRGDLAKAEEDYRQALAIREKLAPGSIDIAWYLKSLAGLLEDRGALDEAEQCYRKALAIWEELSPGTSDQADALAGLASIHERRGQSDQAAELYEKALEALESQTARLGGSGEVRAGFRAKYGKYYQNYGSLLIHQGKADVAFQVLERSRARTLLETLVSSHLDIRRGVDPVLLERERSLRADRVAKSNRRIRLLGEKRSGEQINAVEKEISDLTGQYQDIEARIRSASPAYAALTQPHPLSAEAVQHLLPSDTLLLEYSLGEDHSYVFAMSANSLQSYELPKSGVIEPIAKRLYQSLTERGRVFGRETPEQRLRRITKADLASRRAAAELSRIALGPVASELKKRRLLIVSDGALQYVPFAVLPIPGSSAAKEPDPLIAEHEIVNLPSASVFAVLREQRKSGSSPIKKEAAVFADPVFDRRDPRVRMNPVQLASRERRPERTEGLSETPVNVANTLARSAADAHLEQHGEFHLPRLAFSREEANAILSVAPRGSSMEALDFDASRRLAMSGELGQYRVLHFATHALVDNIHPELSGLVLSLVDRKGTPVDGFLALEDIYNLDLSAHLVVLSACDTALGKEISGEGMISLTRGFMYAGVPRVVATLWNVNDLATAKLMARFYQAMERDGMKPAEALRQAQLTMWKQRSSSAPYYWAALVLQGDWE
jgi:CHAT domain-containing protein/Tfp pilus assembly protein PilF